MDLRSVCYIVFFCLLRNGFLREKEGLYRLWSEGGEEGRGGERKEKKNEGQNRFRLYYFVATEQYLG